MCPRRALDGRPMQRVRVAKTRQGAYPRSVPSSWLMQTV